MYIVMLGLTSIRILIGCLGAVFVFMAFEPRTASRNRNWLTDTWYFSEDHRLSSRDRLIVRVNRFADIGARAVADTLGHKLFSIQAISISFALSLASSVLFNPFILSSWRYPVGLVAASITLFVCPALVRNKCELMSLLLCIITSSMCAVFIGIRFKVFSDTFDSTDFAVYIVQVFAIIACFGVFSDLLVLAFNRLLLRVLAQTKSFSTMLISLVINCALIWMLVEPMIMAPRTGLGRDATISPIRLVSRWFVGESSHNVYEAIRYMTIFFCVDFSNVFTVIFSSALFLAVGSLLLLRLFWPTVEWALSLAGDWKLESDRKLQFGVGTFLMGIGFPEISKKLALWLMVK